MHSSVTDATLETIMTGIRFRRDVLALPLEQVVVNYKTEHNDAMPVAAQGIASPGNEVISMKYVWRAPAPHLASLARSPPLTPPAHAPLTHARGSTPSCSGRVVEGTPASMERGQSGTPVDNGVRPMARLDSDDEM